MGSLASYLQGEFARRCPAGWRVQREHAFMRAELSRIVGFSPRADLCLQSDDGSRRLWVELEVSRADPAANQVKFAAAHLFEPFASSDFFVSMVSAHVAPGRRNLGAQAVLVLRRLGLRAQQTPLLPGIAGGEIKRINHLPPERIRLETIDAAGKGTRVCNLVKISSYYYDLIFFSRKLAKRTKSSGEQERGQENHALSLKEVYSRSRAKRRA